MPVSKERQREMLENQIEEVVHGIEELKTSRGEKFTVKELERRGSHWKYASNG